MSKTIIPVVPLFELERLNEGTRPDDSIGAHSDYRIIEFPRKGIFQVQEKRRLLLIPYWHTLINYSGSTLPMTTGSPYSFGTKEAAATFIKSHAEIYKIPEKIIHYHF